MPARFSGVQRAQPVLATRRRSVGSWTAAAVPFTPAAPISEPPNQAAKPTSCSVRARVLSFNAILIVIVGSALCSTLAAALPVLLSRGAHSALSGLLDH